jgi:hypothetical protein
MTGIRWSDEAPPATRAPGTDAGSVTIEQSSLQQYGGLAFGLGGGLVFLGVAIAWGGQEPMALVGFGFFGVLLLVGSVVALRRGTDRRLIEVGPEGIWLPEMGRLAWPAIREVRLEIVRGVGGGGEAIVPYRRLGVVPLDPDLKPSTAMRLGWGMVQGYARFLKGLAPGLRFGNDDLAPFGLGEPEAKSRQIDEALAVVGRYVPIVDAADERAKARAPRWTSRADHDRPSPIDVGVIDAHLGAPTVAPGSEAFVAPRPQAPPAAVFRTPPLSPKRVGGWFLSISPIVGLIAVAVAASGGFGSFTPVLLLAAGLFVAPIAVRLAPRVLETIRRSLMSEADRTILRIGPEGIWMRGMGSVPWDRVGTVRAEVQGTSPVGLGGEIPRWGLFVQPDARSGAGGGWAVYADQLDASFDDVVDLVRFYHPVEETG